MRCYDDPYCDPYFRDGQGLSTGIAVGVFCLIVIFVIGMLVTKRRRLFTPHIRPGFNTGYYSQQPMGPSQPYVPNQPYAPPPTYPPPATDASVAPGAPYVPPSEPYAPPPGPPPSDDVYKPPVDPPPATYPPPPGPPPSKDSS